MSGRVCRGGQRPAGAPGAMELQLYADMAAAELGDGEARQAQSDAMPKTCLSEHCLHTVNQQQLPFMGFEGIVCTFLATCQN